ncbi:MAG TPA: glutamate--tRNA ligase [bacterium]
MQIRVRMAPSPTGFFHVGSARTALYNWLFARHNRGKFILRVEDTDASRSSREMIDVILESLSWLGLDWDEGPEKSGDYGPYFQSERKTIYREYADRLVEQDKVYWCYCTQEEIEKERDDHFKRKVNWHHRCRDRYSVEETTRRKTDGLSPALRFEVMIDKKVVFNDMIHGVVEKMGTDLEDFVILKSDGMPTYNFACVIDDSLMKITHVIRGVEHIANTPKQMLLYETLNLPPPFFAHLPVILGTDKKKLSKRLGARSVMDYKNDGYLPEALVNFLALLGWSPGKDEEIMAKARMVELFSLERINPANAVYDEARLDWMNNHYIINQINDERYAALVKPFLIGAGLVDESEYREKDKWVQKVCALMRPRLKVLSDIRNASYFFKDDFAGDENAVKKFRTEKSLEVIRSFKAILAELADFTAGEIENALRKFAGEGNIKAKDVIHPLRMFITGTDSGPGLFETMELIGRERCLRRLDKAAG